MRSTAPRARRWSASTRRIGEIRLTDYKVRVLDSDKASAAKVRVLVESTDGRENWTTIGVSTDIINASWQALVDAMEYKLMRDQEPKSPPRL